MIFLYKFSQKRPVSVSMFILGLLLFGILSFYRLPIALFPSLSYPGLTISVDYPGNDADKIEAIITKPIEEAISGIGGIEEIHSFSENGKSEISIEFEKNVNLEFKTLELRERIDLVSSNFPRESHKPIIYRYDPDQRPVMIIVLESNMHDLIEQREIAERNIKRQLENIDGVSRVVVSGGKLKEIVISCDMQKLTSYGISMRDILKKIQSNNINSSVGKIEHNGGNYSVYTKGRYSDISEIRELPVYYSKTKVITITDVANVAFSYRDEESGSRLNGKENVSIYVFKSSRGNVVNIAKEVLNHLSKIRISNIKFNITYNQADTINKTFFNMTLTAITGIFLFSIYVYVRKGLFRTGLLILSSFLLVTVIFFLFLYLAGVELDLVVFAGIIMGLSMWMAIAFQLMRFTRDENTEITTDRRLIQKYRFISKELFTITVLVLAMTVPFYMLDKDTGEASLKLGLTVVCYLFLCLFISLPLNVIFEKMIYEEFSDNNYRSRITTVIIPYLAPKRKLLIILFIAIAIIGIYRYSNFDKEYFYSMDNKKLLGYVELPSGTGFAFTNSITKKIEDKLLSMKEITEVTSRVDAGHSFLLISLVNGIVGDDKFVTEVKKVIGNTDPAFCYFAKESDSGKFKEISIDVLGDDLIKLDELTRELAKKSSGLEGVSEVILRYKPPRDELQLIIDRSKSSKAQLTIADIGDFLRLAIQGGVATKYIEQNKEIDVRIRFAEQYRNSDQSLKDFALKSRENKFVPISEISIRKETKVPLKIFHKNKKRVLTFSLRTGDVSHAKIINQIEEIHKVSLPQNFRIEMGRSVEKLIQNEKRTNLVLLIAFFLFLMITSAYFESIKAPFAVLLNLPVPIFSTILFAGYIFGTISLPIYLALILIIVSVSYQTMILMKLHETEKAESIFAMSIAPIGFLFLPQILFAKEGASFLKEIELSFIFGLAVSSISVPLGVNNFKKFIEKTWSFELLKIGDRTEQMEWEISFYKGLIKEYLKPSFEQFVGIYKKVIKRNK